MIKTFLDILFPIHCLGCGTWNKWLCKKCINENISPSHKTINDHICKLYYLGKYQNHLLQTVIHEYKYTGISDIGIILGKELNKLVLNSRYDFIIPIPLHKKRLKERGFNQSIVLAEQCSIPNKSIIVRKKYTTAQATLNREQRLNNLSQAFRLRKNINNNHFKNKNFLLIDDVYTTGTTINTCASLLKTLKPARIDAIVIALD